MWRNSYNSKNGFRYWEALNQFYEKELKSEEIYRGETSELLKKNLKEIRKNINTLNFTLSHSADVVKDQCLKLQHEVSQEAEVLIKQIKDIRDKMLKEINYYQMSCISNLQSDKILKQNSNAFINEMTKFRHEWSEYLKRYQINDAEMVKANNSALKLENRFKKQKFNLEKSIFNNKLISFRNNQVQIEKTIIGNLNYTPIDAKDIDQLQVFKLADILNDLEVSKVEYLNLDIFENGNTVIMYPSNSNKVNFVVINKDRNICNLTQTNFECNASARTGFKAVKDSLIFYLYDHPKLSDCFILALMDSNLKLTKQSSIPDHVISLDANESNIYCLSRYFKIMIFDYKLNYIKTIGQSGFQDQAYYLTNMVKQIIIKDTKLYCLYPVKIEILNEPTGVLFKSIPIQGNQMAFDSQFYLLVLSISESKIFKYNLEGILKDEIEFKNMTNGIEFLIKQNGQFVFFNKSKCLFYFE